MKINDILYWAARIVAAILMFQTLFYKFTGSEESVYIFNTVGMEPWGRFGVGALELVASVLIIITATAWFGALLALGLMGGAIMMHLTILGIEVQNDGGQLFLYAVIVALCSVFVLVRNKEKITGLLSRLKG
jgi:putative oxidoreductase